jgi:hypothetical protein
MKISEIASSIFTKPGADTDAKRGEKIVPAGNQQPDTSTREKTD